MNKNNNLPMGSYYDQVISRPNVVKNVNQFSSILVIDSRDRNKLLYPNSHEYIFALSSPFQDIIEIELISINYIYKRYLYDNTNNLIVINSEDWDNPINIYIPPGTYDDETLTTKFVNSFNSVKELNSNLNFNLTLNYDKNLDIYYFVNNLITEYQILFKGNGKPYPTSLFSDNTSDDKLFYYKNKTNGKYLGFSENDFNNYCTVNSLTITNIDSTSKKHRLDIMFNSKKEFTNFQRILCLYNDDLQLAFDDDNTRYNASNNNILGFEINTNSYSISILVVFNINLVNKTINNTLFMTNIIIGDIRKEFERDNYLLLDISELNRMNSSNRDVQDSFVKIPINKVNHNVFLNTKSHGTIKTFSPTLGSLDRLTISIKDRKGEILDYNGEEHIMMFAVKCLNKNANLYIT